MSPGPKWIAFALLAVLGGVYLDWRAMPNQSSRALPVMTLVENGELRIDRYHEVTEDKARLGVHYYSEKAPLSSLIVVPLYAAFAPLVQDQHPEIRLRIAISLGAVLCGTIPFLLCMFWSIGRCRNEARPGQAMLAAALSYLGTFTFVYSGTFFGHMLAGLLLVAAYSLLWERERPFLGGLLLGLAFMAEYPAVLAAPVWGAQMLLSRRPLSKVIRFGAGVAPALILTGIYNMAITGNPLDFPYSHVPHQEYAGATQQFGLGMPSLTAMLGLTLGPRRGLFIYSPLLLWFAYQALAPGGRGASGRGAGRRLKELALSPVAGLGVVMVVFFSCYYMWWGGWAYGPRHLIPLTLLWLHAALPRITAGAVPWRVFAPLAGLGVLINWAAKATHGYLIPDKHPFPAIQPLLADLLGGNWSPFNLLSGYQGVSPQLVTALWPALLCVAVVLLLRSGGRRTIKPPR